MHFRLILSGFPQSLYSCSVQFLHIELQDVSPIVYHHNLTSASYGCYNVLKSLLD
ncbi:unnamed protein product [Meloidogyne enterolobii]|uniref:Uncharacterized protein n=1 Tax=Meloidogyne enterolobii TaxID=390850 RepID=A0ACB0XUQ0_MELEN